MAASEESKNEIQQMYVAYYGRAGDPAGIEFWGESLDVAKLNSGDISTIINAFGTSAEFLAGIGMGTTTEQVTTFYQQMFNRDPEPVGLAFWVDEIDSGRVSLAESALAIALGATNTDAQDATTLANKVLAANYYTQQVTETGAGYDTADIPAAVAIIADVTNDPVSVVQSKDATDAAMEAQGGTGSGETILLTTGIDTVFASAPDVKYTVKGVIDYDGTDDNSTFTVANSIRGNDRTAVEIVVADVAGGAFEAPFVQMQRVNELSIINGADGTLQLNASTYGTDISGVSLSGADDLDVHIESLMVEGALKVSVAGGTEAQLTITGTMDSLGFTADVSNQTDNTTTSTLSLGTLAIDMLVGDDADIDASLFNKVTDSAAAVSVGDLTVGDISLVAATSGKFDLSLTNFASNTGTGTATVGDVTVGNITMDIGVDAKENKFHVNNTAEAGDGAATAGSITIGNVDVNIAQGSDRTKFSVENFAFADEGDATVGDITVGDIAVLAADKNDFAYFTIQNSAVADTTGDATAGNLTIGNITMTGGDDSDGMDVYAYNYALADIGNAVVGDMLIGDINMTAGDDVLVSVSVSQNAVADSTGDATVGNVTVGDVNMIVGTNVWADLEVNNYAEANTGVATAGTVTIGDVTASIGEGGTFNGSVSLWASGSSSSSDDLIGNLTVGNVTLFGANAAALTMYYNAEAVYGDVSDVTLGDISMKLDGVGTLDLSIDVEGNNIGDVSIGKIDLDLGDTSASINTFNISVTANTGDIASFTVGNVSIDGGINTSDGSRTFSVWAKDDIGEIALGDISVVAGKLAVFDSGTYEFNANTGSIGDITIGNIMQTAGSNATVRNSFYFTADEQIGNVEVGNVDLNVSGLSASALLELWFSNADDNDLMTVGNIDISLANVAAATTAQDTFASLHINYESDTGDVIVGDISLETTAISASYTGDAEVSASVSLSSSDDLTVGDISVVGGFANTADVVLDNFASLSSWLHLRAGGDISVGDIDYSGYEASATIDASGFVMGGNFTAAQGDTVISDTVDKNVITLGAGTDEVILDNAATTDETDETAIDEIVNFTHGTDLITTELTEDDFVFSSVGTSYADFLTDAAASMTNFSTDVFAQKVGSNTYVAFNEDADGEVDFVIELTGITLVDMNDFNIIT